MFLRKLLAVTIAHFLENVIFLNEMRILFPLPLHSNWIKIRVLQSRASASDEQGLLPPSSIFVWMCTCGDLVKIALNNKFVLFIHVLWPCAVLVFFFFCKMIRRTSAGEIKSFANRVCNCLIFISRICVACLVRSIHVLPMSNGLNEQSSNYRLMA